MNRYFKKKYQGAIGVCTECKEWTSVLDPCCGAPVLYQGSYISIDDPIIFSKKAEDISIEEDK
jgi:hypothetical protein